MITIESSAKRLNLWRGVCSQLINYSNSICSSTLITSPFAVVSVVVKLRTSFKNIKLSWIWIESDDELIFIARSRITKVKWTAHNVSLWRCKLDANWVWKLFMGKWVSQMFKDILTCDPFLGKNWSFTILHFSRKSKTLLLWIAFHFEKGLCRLASRTTASYGTLLPHYSSCAWKHLFNHKFIKCLLPFLQLRSFLPTEVKLPGFVTLTMWGWKTFSSHFHNDKENRNCSSR